MAQTEQEWLEQRQMQWLEQRQQQYEFSKQAPAQHPEQPALEATVEGDKGVLDYVTDMAYGVSAGVNKFGNEVMDLSWGVSNFAKEAWEKGVPNAEFREPTKEEQANMWRLPVVQEAETLPGKMVQSLTQFAAGFATTGAAMKAAKVLQGAGTLSQIGKPVVQEAITDFASFDAHEARFSDWLMDEYPSVAPLFVGFMASKENESMLEGRTKNVLEGFGLGIATEGLLRCFKVLKKGRQAKSNDELIKILEEAQDVKISDDVKHGTIKPDEAAQPEGVKPSETGTPSPQKAEPRTDLLSADAMKSIIKKAKTADEAITEITFNSNLNKMTFNSPQGSHIIKSMGEALAEKTLKGAGKEAHTKILADTTAELKEFGIDYTQALAEAGSDPKAVNALTRRMLANRNVLHMMTTEAARLANKISMGTESLVEQAQFVMLTKNVQEMHLNVADMRTELGRALSALNIHVDAAGAKKTLDVKNGDDFLGKWYNTDKMTNEDAMAWLTKEGWTPDKLDELARDMQLTGGDPRAINTIAKNAKPTGSWWGVATEFRIQNLLSGPTTWAVNAASNAMKTAAMPAELMLGGLLRGDMRSVRIGARTYMGMTRFLKDSWGMAWKATKNNANILDSTHGVFETPSCQMSYDNIKNLMLRNTPAGTPLSAGQELVARAFSYYGNVFGVSSRVMIGTDELFKQLNFRADLYAKLTEDGIDKGLKGHDLRAFVDDSMKKAFDENGAVVRGELTADSLLTAQRATWTQDLGAGTWGGDLQKFTNKHFLAKMILPFIRTPTNLLRDFLAHTPGAKYLSVDYRQMIAKGGEDAARAQGQLAMGSLTIITGIGLAMEGHITGSPPKNTKLRKALEATGWEPYSIKIGDKYYSYRRFDPVGMFLGTCADWTAIFTGKDDLSELTRDEIASTMFAMTMNNITSKTYMQGLSEVVNVINDGDRYFTSFAGRMASTFVPASSMLRTVRKETDPHMREMQNISDYVLNTVPGYSETLPAKHNWVTGQIEDYRLIGQDRNNTVLDELNRLGQSVLGAPLKTLGGVKLSGEQYSRLNELHGTLKLGGKTMEERLHKLFTSPNYDLERNTRLDPPDGLPGPRSKAVEKIINAYRDAAQDKLRKEFPELNTAIREKEAAQWAAKRGRLNKNNKTEVLNKLLNR